MPRIPKIRKTAFPDQMFMDRRTGSLTRRDLFHEDWGAISRTHVPVQGPDMPLGLEQRRQYLRNEQDAYESELAAERERQLFNRRIQAWNDYANLPLRDRQFYPNRDDIARYLVDYDYIPNEFEAYKVTRDLPALDRWSIKNSGVAYPMEDLDTYEGPTDLPPEFIDEPPWRY